MRIADFYTQGRLMARFGRRFEPAAMANPTLTSYKRA
jgi:hypothetical protein